MQLGLHEFCKTYVLGLCHTPDKQRSRQTDRRRTDRQTDRMQKAVRFADRTIILRSASQQLMVAPRHRLSTVGRRAFAVHGPMVWNFLP